MAKTISSASVMILEGLVCLVYFRNLYKNSFSSSPIILLSSNNGGFECIFSTNCMEETQSEADLLRKGRCFKSLKQRGKFCLGKMKKDASLLTPVALV